MSAADDYPWTARRCYGDFEIHKVFGEIDRLRAEVERLQEQVEDLTEELAVNDLEQAT